MSYVQPNTTIELFSGIPFDRGHENTGWWTGRTAQTNYFDNYPNKVSLNNQSYQRVNSGTLRIEKKYEDIYRMNYMRFKNTNHESKWFYAFISGVNYVNEEVCEINYVLDVMQTWLVGADYQLRTCFVEREHTNDDTFGKNTVKENIGTGDYIVNERYSHVFHNEELVPGNPHGYWIVFVWGALRTPGDESSGLSYIGNWIDGVPSGFNMAFFDSYDGFSSLQNEVNYAIEHKNKIVGIYMCPKDFVDIDDLIQSAGDAKVIRNGANGKEFTINTFSVEPGVTEIDGYIPRNNKCYCSPFNFEVAYSSNGGSIKKMYELCKNSQSVYKVQSKITIPPSCTLKNYEYDGVELGNNQNEKLTIDGFPQCPYTENVYENWVKSEMPQKLAGGAISMATGGIGVGVGLLTGNAGIAGASSRSVISGGTSILETVLHWASANKNEYDVHGNIPSMSTDFVHGDSGYTFYRMSCKKEVIEQIDRYFDMFGYAVNAIKTPNVNVRENYWYTKTVNCILSGDIPEDDRQEICNIFNAGVRFWKNMDMIGNYGSNNII